MNLNHPDHFLGELLMNGWSKFVVIIWLFVVLILTSSYTASLSSMLTSRRLQQLSKNGNIGYQSGSLAKNFLNNWNFKDSALRPLNSEEEYAAALNKGGVVAVVDEMPYIKIFLAKKHYAQDYTMTNITYNSNSGFGFAFSKGSPLVLDFSRALAKLREDGKLNEIEQKWFFGYHENILNVETPPESDVLNFYSFRGHFLLMGITSALAFIISYAFLKYNPIIEEEVTQNQVIENPLPNGNISLTLVILDDSLEQPILEEEKEQEEDNALPLSN